MPYDDDSNNTRSDVRDEVYGGRALVAVFETVENARQAAKGLRDEGFHDVWLGVTRTSDYETAKEGRTVEPAGGETIGERIARFFGAGGQRSLYDELVRHGVAAVEARRIDEGLFPNSAVLTVDGANHPELAADIIEQSSGQVIAGEHFAGAGADVEPERPYERGSDILGYRGKEYARGERVDEDRRLQLRSERLDVAKQRVASDEAQVGKDVVERTEEVDVPTVREELFVERRSPSEEASAEAAGEIGRGETIRIPLMRENVIVTKRPVVTDEYVVGKRSVSDTQHVAETLREERLVVNDRAASTPGRGVEAEEPD